MAPRREVPNLLLLSLSSIETFVHEIIKIVSPEIVRYHNDCTKKVAEMRSALQDLQDHKENKEERENIEDYAEEDNIGNENEFEFHNSLGGIEKSETFREERDDINYRKELIGDYVERLRCHIFSHIPYSLIDDVKDKV